MESRHHQTKHQFFGYNVCCLCRKQGPEVVLNGGLGAVESTKQSQTRETFYPAGAVAGQSPKQAAASWTPPPLHGYKINFDGEILEQENRAGLGVVIRNHDGMVMASLSEIIPLPSIVIEVETLAAQRVVEFALELGFDNIFLEGDSEVLIKLLNSSSRSLAPFGHI